MSDWLVDVVMNVYCWRECRKQNVYKSLPNNGTAILLLELKGKWKADDSQPQHSHSTVNYVMPPDLRKGSGKIPISVFFADTPVGLVYEIEIRE